MLGQSMGMKQEYFQDSLYFGGTKNE